MDVGTWGCDFAVCSAYKFFGPHLGVLFGRQALLEELGPEGLLVAPVGDRDLQTLWILQRGEEGERVREGCACRFVPLVGEEGFVEEDLRR